MEGRHKGYGNISVLILIIFVVICNTRTHITQEMYIQPVILLKHLLKLVQYAQ